jgi:hypothetical protein
MTMAAYLIKTATKVFSEAYYSGCLVRNVTFRSAGLT